MLRKNSFKSKFQEWNARNTKNQILNTQLLWILNHHTILYQWHKYFYMHCAIPIFFIVLNSFHFSKLLFAIFKFMITTFYQVKGRRNTSIIFIPSYNQVMRKYVHFVTPKNIQVQRKNNFCVSFSTFYLL